MKKNPLAHKKEPSFLGTIGGLGLRALHACQNQRNLLEPTFMKSTLPAPQTTALLAAAFLLTGCLATPVERSGGPGSVTIEKTNPSAILTAARRVFAERGYTTGPGQFPQHISFQRPAGRTGELFFGSFNRETLIRVRLDLRPIPGTQNFRVEPQVFRVSTSGRLSSERDTRMLRTWSAQFGPMLRQIRDEAANAN
jgi:hypothetical protein